MKIKQRFFSLLLSISMVLTMVPLISLIPVSAAGAVEIKIDTINIDLEDPAFAAEHAEEIEADYLANIKVPVRIYNDQGINALKLNLSADRPSNIYEIGVEAADIDYIPDTLKLGIDLNPGYVLGMGIDLESNGGALADGTIIAYLVVGLFLEDGVTEYPIEFYPTDDKDIQSAVYQTGTQETGFDNTYFDLTLSAGGVILGEGTIDPPAPPSTDDFEIRIDTVNIDLEDPTFAAAHADEIEADYLANIKVPVRIYNDPGINALKLNLSADRPANIYEIGVEAGDIDYIPDTLKLGIDLNPGYVLGMGIDLESNGGALDDGTIIAYLVVGLFLEDGTTEYPIEFYPTDDKDIQSAVYQTGTQATGFDNTYYDVTLVPGAIVLGEGGTEPPAPPATEDFEIKIDTVTIDLEDPDFAAAHAEEIEQNYLANIKVPVKIYNDPGINALKLNLSADRPANIYEIGVEPGNIDYIPDTLKLGIDLNPGYVLGMGIDLESNGGALDNGTIIAYLVVGLDLQDGVTEYPIEFYPTDDKDIQSAVYQTGTTATGFDNTYYDVTLTAGAIVLGESSVVDPPAPKDGFEIAIDTVTIDITDPAFAAAHAEEIEQNYLANIKVPVKIYNDPGINALKLNLSADRPANIYEIGVEPGDISYIPDTLKLGIDLNPGYVLGMGIDLEDNGGALADGTIIANLIVGIDLVEGVTEYPIEFYPTDDKDIQSAVYQTGSTATGFDNTYYDVTLTAGAIVLSSEPIVVDGEVAVDFGEVEVTPTDADYAAGFAAVALPVTADTTSTVDGILVTFDLPAGVAIDSVNPVTAGDVPALAGGLQVGNRDGSGYRLVFTPANDTSFSDDVIAYINVLVDVEKNSGVKEYPIDPASATAQEDINEATLGNGSYDMAVTDGLITVNNEDDAVELGDVTIDFDEVTVTPTEEDYENGFAKVAVPVYGSSADALDGILVTFNAESGASVDTENPVTAGDVAYLPGTLQLGNRTGAGYRLSLVPDEVVLDDTIIAYINFIVEVGRGDGEQVYDLTPASATDREDINEATSNGVNASMSVVKGAITVVNEELLSGTLYIDYDNLDIEPTEEQYAAGVATGKLPVYVSGDVIVDGILLTFDVPEDVTILGVSNGDVAALDGTLALGERDNTGYRLSISPDTEVAIPDNSILAYIDFSVPVDRTAGEVIYPVSAASNSDEEDINEATLGDQSYPMEIEDGYIRILNVPEVTTTEEPDVTTTTEEPDVTTTTEEPDVTTTTEDPDVTTTSDGGPITPPTTTTTDPSVSVVYVTVTSEIYVTVTSEIEVEPVTVTSEVTVEPVTVTSIVTVDPSQSIIYITSEVPGPIEYVTVTSEVPGEPVTVTSIVTLPGQDIVYITVTTIVTYPSQEIIYITVTEYLPGGDTQYVTVTSEVPGETVTSYVTADPSQSIVTVTLPGETVTSVVEIPGETVTSIVEIPGETVTSLVPAGPDMTVTVTEYLPGVTVTSIVISVVPGDPAETTTGVEPPVPPSLVQYAHWGDINLDGKWTTEDVVTLAKIVAGLQDFQEPGLYYDPETGEPYPDFVYENGEFEQGDPRVNANCYQPADAGEFYYTYFPYEDGDTAWLSALDVNQVINIVFIYDKDANNRPILTDGSMPVGQPGYWDATSLDSWKQAAEQFGWPSNYLPE